MQSMFLFTNETLVHMFPIAAAKKCFPRSYSRYLVVVD